MFSFLYCVAADMLTSLHELAGFYKLKVVLCRFECLFYANL